MSMEPWEEAPAVLENLTKQFLSKLTDIRLVLDLAQADDEEERGECLHVIEQCVREKASLDNIMLQLRLEVDRQRRELDRVKAIKEKFQLTSAMIEHLSANIPSHLPKNITNNHSENPAEKVEKKVNDKSSPPQSVREVTVAKKAGEGTAAQNKKQKISKSTYIPSMEYITVDDFDTVPKYMKGRITYNNVNNAIDELNKAYKEKYKILGMKPSQLNDVNRKRCETYKLQETKDTVGECFIVDGDVKDFCNFKLDKVGRNILTILRHCGRMKEIRGSGRTRYAILHVY